MPVQREANAVFSINTSSLIATKRLSSSLIPTKLARQQQPNVLSCSATPRSLSPHSVVTKMPTKPSLPKTLMPYVRHFGRRNPTLQKPSSTEETSSIWLLALYMVGMLTGLLVALISLLLDYDWGNSLQ